jgi:hypothetical protein
MKRRHFLSTSALAAASLYLPRTSHALEGAADVTVPIEKITSGPKAHWFAYYDKLQFSPDDRRVLGMETDFEGRPPKPEESIRVGLVDRSTGNEWKSFGETTSWCWQQGCMLQWVPGSQTTVAYNVRREGVYQTRFQNPDTGEEKHFERATYAYHPSGKLGVGVNFARLGVLRPGYGYEGIADPYGEQGAPSEDGVYLNDFESGASKLIVTLEQIATHEPDKTMEGAHHWFNHLLFNPSGTRFIFLHRWREKSGPWRMTRMFTANTDGSEVYCVNDFQMTSHFIWKNDNEILAWSRRPEGGDRFRIFEDRTPNYRTVGEGILQADGHCTFSRDGQWILTDTYPDSTSNQHQLMLFHLDTQKLVPLGKFFQPAEVRGKPERCDLHPRWSNDGGTVCIDSMMNGQRQLYLLDVSGVVG